MQQLGKEIRIVDAYSASGLTVADYVKVLRDKPYKYEKHYFPHDARAKSMQTGKSIKEAAEEYGLDVEISKEISIQAGINEGRMKLRRCWIDESCEEFLEALSQYRREYDEKKQVFRQTPLHDWTSHFADAYRYLAVSIEDPEQPEEWRDQSDLGFDLEEVA